MFETIVDVKKPAQDLFIEKLEGNFDGLCGNAHGEVHAKEFLPETGYVLPERLYIGFFHACGSYGIDADIIFAQFASHAQGQALDGKFGGGIADIGHGAVNTGHGAGV